MTTKRIAATSLIAYEEIQVSLGAREKLVLDGLRRYYVVCGSWPTAYELFDFLKRDGLVQDLNGCRPRLSALKDKGQVENPAVKRHCRITNKRAYVWSPVQPARLF